MCSVICFPHSTETGTAEGWVSGGRGEGEIRGCLCWCCCWKKCSSNGSLSDLHNVESHTTPRKKCDYKYIHSLKVLRYRAKRAREIKGNYKNNQLKQQPLLKYNVFCHSSASWYCPHSCVFISRHPSALDLIRKILFVAAQPLHRGHTNSETLYMSYYAYKPRAWKNRSFISKNTGKSFLSINLQNETSNCEAFLQLTIDNYNVWDLLFPLCSV